MFSEGPARSPSVHSMAMFTGRDDDDEEDDDEEDDGLIVSQRELIHGASVCHATIV